MEINYEYEGIKFPVKMNVWDYNEQAKQEALVIAQMTDMLYPFVVIGKNKSVMCFMYAEHLQEEIDFDWDCLPKWTNDYIAMDENGDWFAYGNKPEIRNFEWFQRDGFQTIPKGYEPKNFTQDWTKSLYKNPNK